MRFIIATIALVLVANAGASYASVGRPSNVYLPPATVQRPIVTSYHQAPGVITTVQHPIVQQQRVYNAPIVDYVPQKQVVRQQSVYHVPNIVDTTPLRHVVRTQQVYNAPIVNYTPARQQVVRTQHVYNSPIVDYAPRQQVVRSHNVYSTPVVQQAVRPERVYLPPAPVQHPVVQQVVHQQQQQRVIEAPVADYGVVEQPRNTYLPPSAGIDLRSSFADRR